MSSPQYYARKNSQLRPSAGSRSPASRLTRVGSSELAAGAWPLEVRISSPQ